MDRRQLLEGFVMFALVPVAAACGDDDLVEGDVIDGDGGGDGNGDGCDGVGATTSVVADHTHFVCIPQADLDSPPAAGATYVSSSDNAHTHSVELSMEQLQSIAAGESVTVDTTLDNAHLHSVTLVQV